MPVPAPRVSVVVPTYNRGADLGRCLTALRSQDLREPYEILVADDGSDPAQVQVVVELARRDARVRHLPGEHGGVATARNRGATQARGEFLAFVDDDWLVAPDFCRQAVGFLEAHPPDTAMVARVVAPRDCGFMGRVNHLQYETDVRVLLEGLDTLRHHLGNFRIGSHYAFRVQRAPTLSASGGLVLRRATFERVGPFDERLRIGEDTELSWRMRACGVTLVYNPAVEIVHHGPATLRACLRQQFRYGLGLADFVAVTPHHFASLPNMPRGFWLFVRRLATRPLKKALQTDSVAELLAVLGPLVLLNVAYAGGVLGGMWRRGRRTRAVAGRSATPSSS